MWTWGTRSTGFRRRSGPDREEGLKPLDRSGAYLDLVGVFLEAPGIPGVKAPGSHLRIAFLSAVECCVRIKARDYDRFGAERYHYEMIPTQSRFDRGLQVFSWDAGLARELSLEPGDLGVVAAIGGKGYPVVAPLLFQAFPFSGKVTLEGVRFVFVPNETMTVDYLIHPQGQPKEVLQERGGTVAEGAEEYGSVEWARQPGRSVAERPYILKLTASITTPQGFVERIPHDYVFHYQPQLVAGP